MRVWSLPVLAAVFWAAASFFEEVPGGYDVYVLGEFHDNPTHHARQAEMIRALDPKAVVFEMLTPNEARRIAWDNSIDWAGFDWPNLHDYAAVLRAAPVIVGAALAPGQMRSAFQNGAADVFGQEAAAYGLTDPLPSAEQARREALQFEVHCEAMPREMMSGMVEAQRLRDAAFARSVLETLDLYGAPVVLITGNGHGRTDWGVPRYLAHVRPDLKTWSLGQSEAGAITGSFDQILDAPAVERGDPCAAFQ